MSNQPVIDLLSDWAESIGFSITQQTLGEGKSNLIAQLGTGSNGLIVSGHTDTVPMDEPLWHSDPFKLTERENKLYGLGSCDMKSFIAMALHAAQRFDPSKLKRPLTLIATADEETTMNGARMLAENGRNLGRYCIIGEPTNLTPIREHKGILMEQIRYIGQSGHSSDPSLGNSALEGMIECMNALLGYRQQLQQSHQNPAFEVSMPTINLGHIHGGDNPNRICGDCELDIDLRFLPGMDFYELRRQIQQIASDIAGTRGLKVEFTALMNGIPALQTDPGCDLNQFLESTLEQQSRAVAFGTEAPFYNGMGCETIVVGPGSIDQAHQPDEFLPIKQIEPTVNLIGSLIHRYCVKD